MFLGGTATRADSTGETLDLIDKEIHRLAEDGPTAEELAKAKAYLNSSFVLNLDTSSKIAWLLVQLQLDDLGIDYIARRPAVDRGGDARRRAASPSACSTAACWSPWSAGRTGLLATDGRATPRTRRYRATRCGGRAGTVGRRFALTISG